jgi:hypothetical protein
MKHPPLGGNYECVEDTALDQPGQGPKEKISCWELRPALLVTLETFEKEEFISGENQLR